MAERGDHQLMPDAGPMRQVPGRDRLVLQAPAGRAAVLAVDPMPPSLLVEGVPPDHAVETYARQYGCRFVSVMPTNLYGPNDNFDLESSHVLPALIRRIHEAMVEDRSIVTLWGSGRPRREFLHVDDLADACVAVMQRYDQPTPINIGAGSDITIAELAALIAEIVGYEGSFSFDSSRPDGTPRKLLDVSKM
ncbi:MAG: NAD-dependent epimerase/dehydratase family protein, partial [Inquilinus sp.]|uniref:NAD-dependent epimerase/dehydratase family protein n=1 Tax=Inquilinus sp. TaxID=1932117 RepID=UPI003F416CE4